MKPSEHAHVSFLQTPKAKRVQLFFFFASCASLSIMLLQNIACLALLQYATHGLAATGNTSAALNPKLTNTIGDKGGPILYYNGSGPVPP